MLGAQRGHRNCLRWPLFLNKKPSLSQAMVLHLLDSREESSVLTTVHPKKWAATPHLQVESISENASLVNPVVESFCVRDSWEEALPGQVAPEFCGMFRPFVDRHEFATSKVKLIVLIARRHVQMIVPYILIASRFVVLAGGHPVAGVCSFQR